MYSKASVFVFLALMSCALAAPKPINFNKIAKGVYRFGKVFVPAATDVFGFLIGNQGYPQNPNIPQFAGYPQIPGYYPQYPYYYQQYRQDLAPVPSNFRPSSTHQLTKREISSIGDSELDGLNNMYISTPIQDALKNIHELPKVEIPTINTVEDDYDESIVDDDYDASNESDGWNYY